MLQLAARLVLYLLELALLRNFYYPVYHDMEICQRLVQESDLACQGAAFVEEGDSGPPLSNGREK